jgi:hypothetical protein
MARGGGVCPRIAGLVVLAVALLLAGRARAGAARPKEEPMKIAFVLLAKPRLPDGKQLERAFARFATKQCRLRERVDKDDKDDKARGKALAFDLTPGGNGFIGLIDTPVPKREADEAAALSVSSITNGWKLPPHAAHLIVALNDPETASKTERLSRLTWLLAAVAEASDAVGVYWGDAGATHEPKFFISVAKDTAMVGRLMLWTGVSAVKQADGRISVLSTGMKQLGLPNLLLIAPAKLPSGDTLKTFFDLLAYMVNRGEALPEGDTVGRTADERLPVRYVPSPANPGEKVWRVELK